MYHICLCTASYLLSISHDIGGNPYWSSIFTMQQLLQSQIPIPDELLPFAKYIAGVGVTFYITSSSWSYFS